MTISIYEDSGVFSGGSPSNETVEERPAPDPRYNYRYEYKYVRGKLAEMQMFSNTGGKGMRYVYDYKGNLEELVYGYEGKLNQKYVTMFDAKGYELERHTIAVINLPQPDRKYLIKTETFDKEGNWTKRTFLEATMESGKPTYEPDRIEYRTIRYYPESKSAKLN